jgi:hypothetical protein
MLQNVTVLDVFEGRLLHNILILIDIINSGKNEKTSGGRQKI